MVPAKIAVITRIVHGLGKLQNRYAGSVINLSVVNKMQSKKKKAVYKIQKVFHTEIERMYYGAG